MSNDFEAISIRSWPERWNRKSPRPRPWSIEEVRSLRFLLEQGHSWADITIELKRSVNAVKRVARLHGLPTRSAGKLVKVPDGTGFEPV